MAKPRSLNDAIEDFRTAWWNVYGSHYEGDVEKIAVVFDSVKGKPLTDEEAYQAAYVEAHERYQGDIDIETGERMDDWGYSESERKAFIEGATWARKNLNGGEGS
jgi:hypothetical protein